MTLGWPLILLALSATFAAAKSNDAKTDALLQPLPPVSVWLKTPESWPAPTFAIELLEVVAQETPSSARPYFALLSQLIDRNLLSPSTKPKTIYDEFFGSNSSIKSISQPSALWHDVLPSSESASLAKLALAMHSTAPRIEAYYRFYNQTVVPSFSPDVFDAGCAVWADWGHKQVCDLSDMRRMIDSKTGIKQKSSGESLPFDHVYPSQKSSGNPDLVVLYADITMPEFPQAYQLLRDAASDGRIRLVMRYRTPVHAPETIVDSEKRIMYLSGYGVELAMKSTEYKVLDDRDVKNSGSSSKPDAKSTDKNENPSADNDHSVMEEKMGGEGDLYEPDPTIRPLTGAQISELDFIVAQYVVSSPNPIDDLVRVSQSLPKYAHLLADMHRNDIPFEEALKALTVIQSIVREQNALYLNGRQIALSHFNAFELLRIMREELHLVNNLKSLNWTTSQSIEILATPISQQVGPKWGECFDTRSNAIVWLNNIEIDSRYNSFPPGIHEILRPSFPGQLKYVRKNIMSVIMFLDLSNTQHLGFAGILFRFIENNVPLRFGIVPLLHDDGGVDDTHPANVAAMAVKWIVGNLGRKALKAFITSLAEAAASDGARTTPDRIKSVFEQVSRKPFDQTIDATATLNTLRDTTGSLSIRLGIRNLEGAIFANGKHIDLVDNWQQPLVETYFQMIEHLSDLVYTQRVTDDQDIYDLFMTMPNVYPKRNPLVFSSASNPPVVVSWPRVDGCLDAFKLVPWVYNGNNSDAAVESVIVFGDFSNAHGFKFAVSALKAVASSTVSTRIAFVHNGGSGASEDASSQTGVWIDEAAMRIASKLASSDTTRLPGIRSVLDVAEKLADQNQHAFDRDEYADPQISKMRSAVVQVILSGAAANGVKRGDYGVVVNARVIGPLKPSNLFDESDFNALVLFENAERSANLAELVRTLKKSSPEISVGESETLSDLIMYTQSLIVPAGSSGDSEQTMSEPQQPRVNPSLFARVRDGPFSFSVGHFESALLQFTAIVSPVSDLGQKVSAVLQSLSHVSGVAIEVFLNPQERPNNLEKLPVTRFYRFVLDYEPIFGSDGELLPVGARFERVPTAPLWTLGMDVPGPWIVRPTRSIYDLDNIKLSSLQKDASIAVHGVEADFVLQSILVEGHARDVVQGGPPRGLQFVLGTETDPNMVDTITMANLGYLQLKANPGVWHLCIREGRSREVYELESLLQTSAALRGQKQNSKDDSGSENGIHASLLGKDTATVIVDSFEGVTVFPYVRKRAGMKDEDVLAPKKKSDQPTGGPISEFWSSVKQRVFGSGGIESADKNTTINVFSVASGHLYERFLSIMMLSVKQQTTSPVKFWLIENFLSPSFMAFLPRLAESFGFEYELVTYKWPKWLREQTEKQRIIWGYKILFLDVLFPLKLDKVIFVDADQVVRADLRELVDMDLQGAVYGYTPFCDDRPEMDGFRFWKHGYWRDHLRGRPYHISALYVVDLAKFREVAAGDRLRQQYHMLSADPNSLANLDQDLPNNMIHDIPMFSLPQEWLWCETWCSDASLKRAKTIDLCNNPLTKEPKLERARRILSEWEGLDQQVQQVRDAFEAAQKSGLKLPKTTSSLSESISSTKEAEKTTDAAEERFEL